ncbi:MAG: HAD family hydrolase [Bariatricus sp.]|nr:HAD family hydrolase [Bariatricus sp.]
MVRACVFDLDGTLTDTLDSLWYSVNETLKELREGSITREQCRCFVGDGARCLVERALRATGDEKLTRIEEAMQIFGRVFGVSCTYHVVPYEGILTLLKELKSRGIKIAVFTNKPHRQAVDVVESIFGEGVFDLIRGQREGFPKKPDPAGLLDILKEFGVQKDETIYIGDSEVDVRTGKAAQVLTIGVNWGFRSKEILEQTGADATIDRACELLGFL